ncbi:MAG TPA: OsmC family protein [Bacillota bacterium]
MDQLKLDVRARWQGKAKTAVHIRDFPPLYMDEPPAMGGGNAGPSPMEYVLAALCGCTAIILRMVAGEIGVAIESLELAAEGTIDPRGLKGDPKVIEHFQKIAETVRLTTDASPELLERLKEEWVDRCPAYNLVKDAGIDLTVDWEIHRP